MLKKMLKSWKIKLLVATVVLSLAVIAFKGIELGIDFKGGTVLIFSFDRELELNELTDAVHIIEKRLNWTGLSSVYVKPWGKEYVIVELAESDPEKIESIKESVLKQGYFEAVVEGNVVLTGKDILSVKYDYTILPQKAGVRWILPFRLTPEGMARFYKGVYGTCDPECPRIYMYIDRPVGWAVVGDPVDEINGPGGVKLPFDEAVMNSGVKVYTPEEINKIEENKVILSEKYKEYAKILEKKGKQVKIVGDPYFWWNALGIKSTATIEEDLTHVSDLSTASPDLEITGWAKNREEAKEHINELKILLESGALPAGIYLVSEYRIPPSYGEYLFYTFLLALFVAMITVSLYVALRYRHLKIALPIAVTIFSEIIIIFALASLINWKMDVPSMIGIIAAVGTGVDNQIIITDEILRGKRKEEKKVEGIVKKIKNAFFLVFASAFALVAAMTPVFFSGITLLTGFAITTILGVFVGVLITRQAFAEMMRALFS